MIKFLVSALVCFLSIPLFSQEKPIIKYYDSAWSETSKESAFFYAEFSKQGDLYKCAAYWVKPQKLNALGFFADTSLTKPRKLLINYYENGGMQDSSWYDENSQVKFAYHYRENGKLLARHFYDPKTDKEVTEGIDEDGMLKKDFIYSREASFPGGNDAFLRFLSQNLNNQIPIKNGAPKGSYQVKIIFVINQNGKVVNITPETQHGYGMEEEAIRVIRKSPHWKPLIHLGVAKNAYRRQLVSFVVTGK